MEEGEYKLILDQENGSTNISFYLADVIGHDFIHDMNLSSTMGRKRWEKLNTTVKELVEVINSKNGDSTSNVHRNLNNQFEKVKNGGNSPIKVDYRRAQELILSPLRNGQMPDNNSISSAVKDLIEAVPEPTIIEQSILPIFLNFYRTVAFHLYRGSLSVNLETIFSGEVDFNFNGLKFNSPIRNILKWFLIHVISTSANDITSISFDDVQASGIIYNDKTNIDFIDIFIYETQFYLFGLIENPSKQIDTSILDKAFDKYIQLNPLPKQTGGAVDCDNIETRIKIIGEKFKEELINRETRETRETAINNVIQLFDGSLMDNEKKQIRRAFENYRHDKKTDFTFPDIMRQICPSKQRFLNSNSAVAHDFLFERDISNVDDLNKTDMNHINKLVARYAIGFINFGETTRVPHGILYHSLNAIINSRPTNIDANLLTSMLSVSDSQKENHQILNAKLREKSNSNTKCIINNASHLNHYQSDMVFCPITSVIDSMPNCPYHNIQHFSNKMNICVSNESRNFFYRFQLDKPDTTPNCKITVTWKIPSIVEEIKAEYEFDPREKNALSASVVLKNILDYLIQHATSSSESSPNFWESVDKTQIIQHGIIKSCGDIGQELTALCKYGGFVGNKNSTKYDADGNAPIVYLANDRPSGCRYVFVRNTIINDNRLRMLSQLNEESIGGYWSRRIGLVSAKMPPNPDNIFEFVQSQPPTTNMIYPPQPPTTNLPSRKRELEVENNNTSSKKRRTGGGKKQKTKKSKKQKRNRTRRKI